MICITVCIKLLCISHKERTRKKEKRKNVNCCLMMGKWLVQLAIEKEIIRVGSLTNNKQTVKP